MVRLLALCLLLSGCLAYAEGQGTSGDVAWAFTINNTLSPIAGLPGGGGLVVIVSYSDGSSASYMVANGASLSVPARGASARVQAGALSATAVPGSTLFLGATGWSPAPLAPLAGG